MTDALVARGLYRFFHTGDEEVVALSDVSITVPAGRMIAIMGPSGSGKSTLLACLAGLDEPDAGLVRVARNALSRRPEPERAALRARHIGVLYQTENLIGHLTIRRNIEVARMILGRRRGERSTADEVLGRLGLAERAAAFPAELSGGEAARAGLAVALANDPLVLLADEPTGEVDESTETDVLWLLREHADRGHAVVVVTHSPAVAAVADEVVRIADGRVAA
jgi:putative ABC transport system ATP-binding protein